MQAHTVQQPFAMAALITSYYAIYRKYQGVVQQAPATVSSTSR